LSRRVSEMRFFSKLLISTLIISIILCSCASAQQFNINAQILPIQSYTVYAGQSYTLSVNVQYNIDPKTESNIGPILLYVYSPPYSSSKAQVSGSGSRTLTLPLVAPTQPGSYTLGIKLQADSKQAQGELVDTATVNYNVVMPVENDWAVTKVWITPDSPSPGDEVTFQDKFIQDNIRDFVFSVEPYYAMINFTFVSPSPVLSGNGFPVSVHVVYSFPESTELRIGIIFPIENMSFGFNMTADQIQNMSVTTERYDTVSGTGSRAYGFNLTAPTLPFTTITNATGFMGISKVEFNRGEGAGWEHTDPGFADDFMVYVAPHTYYAIIDISDIAYLGEASPFDPNNPKGRFRANIEVEYLLPEENARLRLMLTESKGTRIYDGTSGAKGEGKRTYPIEFELPLDVKTKDYAELFDVEVSYEVEEKWHSGDSRSSTAPVSISEAAISAKPGTPSGSAFEPVADFFKSIADFFRGLFG